jgi:hypothetical protein
MRLGEGPSCRLQCDAGTILKKYSSPKKLGASIDFVGFPYVGNNGCIYAIQHDLIMFFIGYRTYNTLSSTKYFFG